MFPDGLSNISSCFCNCDFANITFINYKAAEGLADCVEALTRTPDIEYNVCLGVPYLSFFLYHVLISIKAWLTRMQKMLCRHIFPYHARYVVVLQVNGVAQPADLPSHSLRLETADETHAKGALVVAKEYHFYACIPYEPVSALEAYSLLPDHSS
jgi:hypothetical protein